MSSRPHPRLADTNPLWPRGWATCDRCGFQVNLVKLRWDTQYAGMQLINLRFLVCEYCVDVPQQQLRTLILPSDPPGLLNARVEPYTIDETDWRTVQDGSIRETQDGSLRVTQPSQTEAETEDPDG